MTNRRHEADNFRRHIERVRNQGDRVNHPSCETQHSQGSGFLGDDVAYFILP